MHKWLADNSDFQQLVKFFSDKELAHIGVSVLHSLTLHLEITNLVSERSEQNTIIDIRCYIKITKAIKVHL